MGAQVNWLEELTECLGKNGSLVDGSEKTINLIGFASAENALYQPLPSGPSVFKICLLKPTEHPKKVAAHYQGRSGIYKAWRFLVWIQQHRDYGFNKQVSFLDLVSQALPKWCLRKSA
jgi:hypothetical protein